MELVRQSNWIPVIDDPSRLKKIADIIDFIGNIDIKDESDDLMYGNIGISIYQAYHYKLTRNENRLNKSVELALKSVEAIAENRVGNLYFGRGITGILWGINHLAEIGILSNDIEDLVDTDFFEILKQSSVSNLQIGDYDYMLGGLGPILLFKDTSKFELVSPIIQELLKIRYEKENQIFWYQSPSITNPNGGKVINVGLAHGIPSILKILSEVKDVDDRITDIILRGFDWLKNNQLEYKTNSCYFPFSYSDDYEPFPAPLRWCYGDLGIAIGLYLAGRNIGSSQMMEYALGIAYQCTERELDPMKIDDTHICHGTAGIAQIFSRFYNYTYDLRFKSASIFWFDETIRRFDKNTQSGFKAWKGDEFEWVEFKGFLEGSAGIGVTLISAISDIEPKWDRCILLS